ncbi:MAG: DUF3857 domain-containing transglutaminase family protein [Pseudobdellovibrionaceae bacterium]|nr:DUF3857 domain-containing transglutaminase family protein [Bdellovibrionales bacterium]USN46162.1 MAG: DUF3857 domain-containing transglutaminase family protein [Pseudobdellovibrionaceae bacterium]
MEKLLVAPLLLIGLWVGPCHLAEARWMDPTENDIKFLKKDQYITVDSSGTYLTRVELVIEILSESGVLQMSRYPLTYNAGISKITVKEAFTETGAKTFAVPKENIEERAIDAGSLAFDQVNRIRIAFEKLEVGSRVHLTYEEKSLEVVMPGHFSYWVGFGWNEWLQSSQVVIDSALRLHVQENDPNGTVSIRKTTKNGRHILKMQLKKPIFQQVTEEKFVAMDPTNYTWVQVSTEKNWKRFADYFTKSYETILSEPLPDNYVKIKETAATAKALEDQVNLLMSQLSDQIKYLGDWRTVKGRYIARPLAEIASSGYGDCKDYSVSLVKLLRSLGYKAYVSLVYRTTDPMYVAWKLPSVGMFNHAFVYIESENKKLWVDPTNYISYSKAPLPDTHHRQALVLKTGVNELSEVPEIQLAEGGSIEVLHEVDVTKIGPREERLSYQTRGMAGQHLVQALLLYRSDLTRDLVEVGADMSHVTDAKLIEKPDKVQRILEDVKLVVKYQHDGNDMRTSAGRAYLLTMPTLVEPFLVSLFNRVGDIELGHSSKRSRVTRLNNVKVLGDFSKLNCKIKSPWLEAHRTIEPTDSGVVVSVESKVLARVVPARELGKGPFKKLRREVEKCFRDSALIYEAQ